MQPARQLCKCTCRSVTYLDSVEQLRTDRRDPLEELSYLDQLQILVNISTLQLERPLTDFESPRTKADSRLEAPSITSPQPFTSTSTPLLRPRSCKSPLRGYITSGPGAKTTKDPRPCGPAGVDADAEGREPSFSDTPSPRILSAYEEEDDPAGRRPSLSDTPSPRREEEGLGGRRVRRRSRSRSSVRG